jgi:uncharacterized protein
MTTRPTVLITGASEGIGRELAGVFAEHGYDLIVVSRTRERLASLADELHQKHKVDVLVIVLDLAQPESSDELFRQVTELHRPIDVLVNNAGFGTYGDFAGLPWEPEAELLQVNIATLTHLTRLFLPAMLKRRSGRILNVASVAAYYPGPLMATYYASKAYVHSFTLGIADEIRGSGVTISVLCPGPTKTQFHARALMEDARMVTGRRRMPVAKVARIGYRGLMAGKTIILPGLQNKLLAQIARAVPDRFAASSVRYLHERNR